MTPEQTRFNRRYPAYVYSRPGGGVRGESRWHPWPYTWRWVRRLAGGHWECWRIGPNSHYFWVKTREHTGYVQDGWKSLITCEDYTRNTRVTAYNKRTR